MTQYLDPAELYAPDEIDVTLLCLGNAHKHTVIVRTEPHREQPIMNEPWRTNLMLSQLIEPTTATMRSLLTRAERVGGAAVDPNRTGGPSASEART